MTTAIRPPIIGVTTYSPKETGRYYVPGLYVEAVQEAGGIPLLLPPVPVNPALMLEQLDGLVLIGGGDIDPKFYNGSPHPKVYGVDTERDIFELALIEKALKQKLPVLGICRGLEIMVVAGGGDLYPHLPERFDDVVHRTDAPPRAQHEVSILANSKIGRILGTTETTIVSLHHQATKTVPRGWRAVAWADDGVIEAIECETHPFAVGVQWHPELSESSAPDRRLFEALVAAAMNVEAQWQLTG